MKYAIFAAMVFSAFNAYLITSDKQANSAQACEETRKKIVSAIEKGIQPNEKQARHFVDCFVR